jgi:hypothetical protein
MKFYAKLSKTPPTGLKKSPGGKIINDETLLGEFFS